MLQRFSLFDLRVIGHYLGTLIVFSGLLMAVPFLVAVVFQEWEPASRYFCSIGIALVLGMGLRFLRIGAARLTRRQALAVTGFAWIVLAFVCSIPLYFSGHYLNYMDALFDGVSGLTTTGATVIMDLDHLSYADNTFRFMMHLLGGLGLIVVALSIGIFGKRTGSTLYTSEGRSEHVVPNVVQTTQFIARITAVVVAVATVVLTVFCLVAGMEPARAALQAFWLAVSGFVTGGFAPMSASVSYYHSVFVEFLLMVLMILGSVSFVIHAEVWKGRVGMFLAGLVAVFAAASAGGALFSALPALVRRGVFMIVSAFSTTGFQVITTNQLNTVLTSGAFLTLALAMAIGGGAGSTSGGIKLYRIGIIFKSVVQTVKETLAPDSARVVVAYNHVGRRILTPEVVKSAMTVTLLYVATYVTGVLVGIAHGYDANAAIFESVAMTSNGGIVTGLVTPGMSWSLEGFYILQMWAGRLEFVALLALVVEVVASVLPRRRGGRQR